MTIEGLGKKFQEARLARGLPLDEAARLTKIRPSRLAEIEADDFSQFPSLAYAKGFLLIYGKFLDVDVTPYLDVFETSREVTVDGYSYLQDQPAPKPRRVRPAPRSDCPASARAERRPPLAASGSDRRWGDRRRFHFDAIDHEYSTDLAASDGWSSATDGVGGSIAGPSGRTATASAKSSAAANCPAASAGRFGRASASSASAVACAVSGSGGTSSIARAVSGSGGDG